MTRQPQAQLRQCAIILFALADDLVQIAEHLLQRIGDIGDLRSIVSSRLWVFDLRGSPTSLLVELVEEDIMGIFLGFGTWYGCLSNEVRDALKIKSARMMCARIVVVGIARSYRMLDT